MNLDPILLAELQRGGPPLWVSGRTYPVGFVVRSPGNLESYVRVTAGAGNADPSGGDANWMLSSKRAEDAVAAVRDSVSAGRTEAGWWRDDVKATVNAARDAVQGTVNASANNIYGQVVDCHATVRGVSAKADFHGRMWTAGAVIEQGGLVISPLDKEVYRRVANTGASGTDPADDITNYVAVSYARTAALPTGYQIFSVLPHSPMGITKTAQTDIGQGVRTQVLSASGRGQLMHVGHYRYSSSSSVVGCRVEIFIDGRQIYAWEPVAGSTHYAVHYGNALRTTDGYGNPMIAAQHAGGLAFRRSVAVWITPTYGNWLNGNQEFVGYWIRSEA